MAIKKLEDFLQEYANMDGQHVALVHGDKRITYSQLYELCIARSEEFLTQYKRAIVVRASQEISFVIDYFAAHLAEKVFVPLEKDIPNIRFEEIRNTVSQSVIPNNVVDILFTTGTTGKQKGVMISDIAIVANAENLITAQGFCRDTVFVISGPLNHIGSLSKIWPVIMVGGTIIITEGMKDIPSFFQALNYESNKLATFLVPASLRMLMILERSRLESVASKFDFIETGAAYLSKEDMCELCNVFPNTRLYNTYASTETGIICTYDYNNNGCVSGCVGNVMKHSEVSLSKEGYIRCKGKTLMSGYVGDEALTNCILRDGVLYTSDLGKLDSDERLFILGREGDVINIGGYKVMPTEVEEVASAYQGVSDCICISVPHKVVGNVLKLLYSLIPYVQFDKKAFVTYLKRNLESYKVPLLYDQVDYIRRTYNGKLDRNFYKT